MRISTAFPIVISGPSGVGKTTLVNRLVAADPLLRESISTTTRQPRAGEVTGKDYFFVARDVFEAMKARELVEWAEVHGEYYGTPRRFVEQELEDGWDVVLNVDVQGGASVRKVFPKAVLMFILPPSFAVLEERMRQRGDTDVASLARRLENARVEITDSRVYEYIVINDNLDQAVAEAASVITAERCRRARLIPGTIDGT